MIQHMLIRLNMVKELNDRLGKHVIPGRYVSLDEKHKGCQKDKHLSRWVHGKEPNWDHWISEVCTPSSKFDLPIIIKVMPLTSHQTKKSNYRTIQ